MFELNGKYGNAKVFTDLVEQSAISQIINMLDMPFAENCKVRIMPDVHAGAGCTIGTTMEIKDAICPNLVGVDVCCGMYVVQLEEKHINFELLDAVIREYVPSGYDIRTEPHQYVKDLNFKQLQCINNVDIDRAKLSLGTLGGGNHFIEVAKNSNDTLYLVIHTGSRHLGKEVAEYYQRQAIKQCNTLGKDVIHQIVSELKAQGRHTEIEETLKALKEANKKIPERFAACCGQHTDLAYLRGDLMDAYLSDIQFIKLFATMNRRIIAEEICYAMDLHPTSFFTTLHNYVDVDNMILRKGAVSAQKGEQLIIPMNMRDGSLICIGKGNPDWNYSAPHGAGRLMSRAQAKEQIKLADFQNTMHDVWSTSVSEDTIDESPMAYKPMESIVENIKDTVDVVDVIKPVYNFKAGKQVPNWKQPQK